MVAHRGARLRDLGLGACLIIALASGASAQVLLSGAWADGVQTGEPDEAIEIVNASASSQDVSGWRVEDDDGGSVLLGALSLAPGERAWIARDAAAFTLTFGQPPSAEVAGTDPAVPDITGTWPALANTGDVVALVDPIGVVRDVLVYGAATATRGGWNGPPADAGYDPAFGNQLILTRDRVEFALDCEADTDSAVDWDDPRLERPGATHLLPLTFTSPTRVRAAIGPDGTREQLEDVILGARSSLRVCVYELRDPGIGQLLRDAMARGVALRLLLEGEIVGGVTDDERWIAADLAAAGADVRWLRADAGEVKRYPFTHAKYAVADGTTTLVASENFGKTGHPADPTWGNRGWSLRVDDVVLATWLEELFDDNALLRHADIAPHDAIADAPTVGFVPDFSIPSGWHRANQAPLDASDVLSISPAFSPDMTSLMTGGILGLLRSATSTLDLQQLSVPLHWGASSDPSDLHPSLFLGEIVAAARRGVGVRVLLDASWYSVELTDPRDNDDTCAYLNALAATESLSLECRLLEPAWLGLTTIHVKGVIADGRVTHVGSTNGTSNSFRLNREAGLQVDSPQIAAYFGAELARDWFVAGVGAEVPTEVSGLRLGKEAGELRATWELSPMGSPAVDGWRLHAGLSPATDAGWSATADVVVPTALSPMPAGDLVFLVVTAYAVGPGGTVEGPSGFADDWLDR